MALITQGPRSRSSPSWRASGRVRGTLDGIWYYPDPLRKLAGVEGYVTPYSERVDPIGDGQLPQRPGSPLAAPTPSRQETI